MVDQTGKSSARYLKNLAISSRSLRSANSMLSPAGSLLLTTQSSTGMGLASASITGSSGLRMQPSCGPGLVSVATLDVHKEDDEIEQEEVEQTTGTLFMLPKSPKDGAHTQ